MNGVHQKILPEVRNHPQRVKERGAGRCARSMPPVFGTQSIRGVDADVEEPVRRDTQ